MIRFRSNLTCFLILTSTAAALVAAAAPRVLAQEKASLSIEPQQAKIRLGEGMQFRARLKGSTGTVKWSLAGKGGGKIAADGYYQAPTSAQTPSTVRIIATVEGEPPLTADARVFFEPISVSVKPTVREMATGETFQFRAEVKNSGDQRVTWSVQGGESHGRITDAGLFTAPIQFATPGTITVVATSVADPSKSATASVRLGKVDIEIEPKTVKLKHGETVRFKAKVKGSPNTAIEWSVVGENNGTISPTGLYTTPPSMTTPAEVTVIARSAADPTKYSAARIRVDEVQLITGKQGKVKQGKNGKGKRSLAARAARGLLRAATPRVVRLVLPFDPIDLVVKGPNFQGKSGKQYVPLGGGVDLEAMVTNSANPTVKWEIVGDRVGEITEEGVYYAPENLTTPRIIQVRATSVADPTKSVLHTLHIPPVVIDVSKNKFTCPLDGAIQLSAQVENAENAELMWSVEGGSSNGVVTETGLYQPPASIATPAVIRVRAAAAADPTKVGIVEVHIPEVKLELSAEENEIRPGRSVRIRPRVKGIQTTGEVEWRLIPNIGTISADGVYQAPADGGSQVVQIQGTLKADPTKTAVTTIRINAR